MLALFRYILICICIVGYFTHLNAEPKMGKFDLLVKSVELCNGPKKRSCASVTVTIVDEHFVSYDLIIYNNTTVEKGKITFLSNGKETFRFQIKDPCAHLFLKPVLEAAMQITSNCQVHKGKYHNKLDLQDIVRRYYAGEFWYGNWSIKTILYSNVCTISCSTISLNIVPVRKEN